MTTLLSHQLVEPGFGTSRLWDLVDTPDDTSIDSLLKPETWANLAAKLKVGDEIIVKPLGLPYRAHLIVMDAGRAFAKVRVIAITPLNASLDEIAAFGKKADAEEAAAPEAEAVTALPADAPVKVEWKGPSLKYSIIRKADGEKLRTGFAIKAEAEAWAIDHVVAMAA